MRFMLNTWPAIAALVLIFAAPLHAQTQYFVAPTAQGNGSGSSAANAAAYTNATFWGGVRGGINGNPITVTFLDGQYAGSAMILSEMGSANHRLTLQSQTPGGAVFAGGAYLQLRGVQNATVRNFGFTGNHPTARIYKLQATSSNNAATGIPSRDILFEGNRFYDAPTYYGAIGVAHYSHHVTIYNNTFRNIGGDGHAHMVYTAYDVHHIKVIGNSFEDVPGDYVRFRDNADFGEVRLNTFRSTASAYNRPFVHIPVANDVNPGDEIHASNYLVRDNSFVYESTAGSPARRNVMGYHSGGYEPAGLNYLPSAADGAILTGGTATQKRQLLLDTMNIDLAKVRVYDNTYTNANYRFKYSAVAAYGSTSQGWTGEANIYDAINTTYLGAGDVYSDALLDEQDVALFLLAVEAIDELSFLLDNRVWFGDYDAADLNGDGIVDAQDAQPFLNLFAGRVSEEALAPVRALVPEPAAMGLLACGGLGLLARRRARLIPTHTRIA